MKNSLVFLSIILCAVITGCGRNPSLSGKVVFSDDKTPLTMGTVVFLKSDYTARGTLKNDGTYTVRSDIDGRGLPKGTYQVYVEGAEDFVDNRPYALIDNKFTNANTSGLTLTIEKSQTYNFEVERNKIPVPRASNASAPQASRQLPGGAMEARRKKR